MISLPVLLLLMALWLLLSLPLAVLVGRVISAGHSAQAPGRAAARERERDHRHVAAA